MCSFVSRSVLLRLRALHMKRQQWERFENRCNFVSFRFDLFTFLFNRKKLFHSRAVLSTRSQEKIFLWSIHRAEIVWRWCLQLVNRRHFPELNKFDWNSSHQVVKFRKSAFSLIATNADGNWGWQYRKFASHAKSISCESKNVIRHIATNWLERSLHRRSLKGVSNVWINIILFIKHHLSFFSRECSGVITRAFNWIFHAYLTSDIFSLVSPRWQARVYDKVEIERTDVRQLFRLQDKKILFSLCGW